MRTFLTTTLIIVGLLIGSAYFIGNVLGIEPQDRRPGTRLAGVVTPLPDDWSVTESAQEVHLETYPWFGIPFSVTTVLAWSGDDLYIPSIYAEPAQFPGSKFWNKVVAANPNVRLRVGDALYELRIENTATEADYLDGVDALAEKYEFWETQRAELQPPGERRFAILRLSPRNS